MVHAYAPTMAPSRNGKRHGPAQCGRKAGIVSAPAAGLICAKRVPAGHPRDPSSVWPRLDKVQDALALVVSPNGWRVLSLGGALGLHAAPVRQALHARGLRTVGMPTSVEPIHPAPSPAEVLAILNASGVNRLRTPRQVRLAGARGDRRPGGAGPMATLRTRGADQVRDKGLEGAVIQMGLTVMAHHGAVWVRVGQQRLAKRGQKFRRLLGLKR
jgi:hypothetical protein